MLLSIIYITVFLATIPYTYKVVRLGHLTMAANVYIFPLTYILGDVVTEVYGYKISRNLLWCSIVSELLFGAIMTVISYTPSYGLHNHQQAYDFILRPDFYAVIGGTLGILSGDFLNIYILSKLKVIYRGKWFLFRSVFSSALGELLTLLISGAIVFFHFLNVQEFFAFIFSMFIFQLIYIGIGAVPAYILSGILKKAEDVDIYDVGIEYNPFKFTAD